MVRGSHLFSSLFDKDVLPAVARQRKGRSDELNDRRNELLLARYYWYGRFTDYRYPVILRHLSGEFFLTERTIQDIIQEGIDVLRKLRKQEPNSAYFKKEWPHLVW